MVDELGEVDLQETADKCLNSGIEPLEKDVYNYAMTDKVYFMENGIVAKFMEETRADTVEENKNRLDSAGIPYPESVSGELGNSFDYGFVVVQRKMKKTFRDLIEQPVDFVDQVFEDIIEPASEQGFEVDTKPQNIYQDPETGRFGMLDINDGKSTRADRTKPENWMRYELKTGLNDLSESYENMQKALDRI